MASSVRKRMRQSVPNDEMDDRNGAGNKLSRYNIIAFHMVYDLSAAQLKHLRHAMSIRFHKKYSNG